MVVGRTWGSVFCLCSTMNSECACGKRGGPEYYCYDHPPTPAGGPSLGLYFLPCSTSTSTINSETCVGGAVGAVAPYKLV